MATPSSFNKNNSAVRRIMQEARELANDPSTEYTAAPLEDNLFEWHCTLRGAPDTEFEGGLYHFRIVLPAEYPFRPPSLMMLTPSGRFETNTKLCISFTNYHEELWQPAWGVRTAIIGLQGFFPLKGEAAVGVGALETPASERRRLAKLSREWVCPQCKIPNSQCLPDPQPQLQPETGTVQQSQTQSDSQTCIGSQTAPTQSGTHTITHTDAQTQGQSQPYSETKTKSGSATDRGSACGGDVSAINNNLSLNNKNDNDGSRSEEDPNVASSVPVSVIDRGANLSEMGGGKEGEGVIVGGEEENRMVRIRDESRILKERVGLGGEKEEGKDLSSAGQADEPSRQVPYSPTPAPPNSASSFPRALSSSTSLFSSSSSSSSSTPAFASSSLQTSASLQAPLSSSSSSTSFPPSSTTPAYSSSAPFSSPSPSYSIPAARQRRPTAIIVIDGTISVLLVLVAALLCRKFL